MYTIPLWRKIQKKNFTNVKTLCNFLQLDEAKFNKICESPKFGLNLPLRLANKIKKNCFDDPILKQFLPLIEEEKIHLNYCADPVQDFSFRKEKKLLHKYKARALLLASSACAMNCRFCFRQNFEYEVNEKGFEKELAFISSDTSLKEIILSGGDPLSLSNASLKEILFKLSEINHLKIIRFHTRFPVGIPERIDEEFLTLLAQIPKQFIFVIHVNHPHELDEDLFDALKKIQKLAIPVLTQSVLLKSINDDFTTLKLLFESLIERGILPYYLHQLDQVQGTKHFFVEKKKGLALVRKLREALPGYAVPRYVCEIPGKKSKTLL